nr:MAG TPA: hypothetical protein [Caudoviricetes sp.]
MLFPIFPARCFIFSSSPFFTLIIIRLYVLSSYRRFARVAAVPTLSPPIRFYHLSYHGASIYA